MKTCTKCQETKPLEAFHKQPKGKFGRRGACIPCQNAYDTAYYRANPERAKARVAAYRAADRERTRLLDRKSALRRKYGLTVEEYEELLVAQDGVCAICGAATPEHAKNRYFDVDHDHGCCPAEPACGRCVRGLLCNPCNTGLSRFSDDPDRLEAAARYLRRRSA